MKDSTGFIIILAGLIGILAVGLILTDKGIEKEGTVIGTFVWNGDTKCIVLVDNVRYDGYCHNIEGDKVKIIIYENGLATIRP